MKQLCFLVLLYSCVEEDITHNTTEMVGSWSITWTIDNESAMGLLSLEEDHTGNMVVHSPESSALVQGDHNISVIWEKEDDLMTLKRMDNAFELNYTITSETDSAISLLLFDEVHTRMQRMH